MKYWLLSIFLCTLSFTAFGQQYETMRVAKIDFIPENLSTETTFSPSTVRARLHTKVGNLFSQSEFDEDLKMLAEEYDQVIPSIEVINNELYVCLRIWFKPTIREILICGNEQIASKKLLKELDLECGTLFEREAFVTAFNKLKLLYVKKGYFEAELDYEIIPLESGNIDIQITVCEGRAGKIKEICLVGLTSKEESEILEELLSKPYNLLLSWYTGRGVYHPDMIEQDRHQITTFLQNKGYADATVEITIEESPRSDRINVVITVEKGACYNIGNIVLTGNTLFSSEEIYDEFDFGIGSPYSPEKIRSTVKAIHDLYGSCGYIETGVDIQLSIQEGCAVYDICVVIEESQQYHVGLIKVFGNCFTQTKIILHESLLFPGEVFDNRKLEMTEARLVNTTYFQCVNVYAVNSQVEDPCGEKQFRDIYIVVEETDTGNLGLFGGFSSIDRIFGGVEITERNFNIMGIPHLLERGPPALRGGGEFANAKINIGDRQTSYIVQWTKPYFLDTPWFFGVELEKNNNRVLSRAYEIKTYGGHLHATYLLNDFLKYNIYYRARHTRNSIRGDQSQLLEQEGNKAGFISAIGNALIYDSTDNPRRASCGIRSKLGYEVAGVGGDFSYMKFSYLNTYYYSFGSKITLKSRADLQFIKTYGDTRPRDLPLSERLYLGGETTVRGYRNFIIGPKFGNNEPRGGVSSMLVSEEIQRNLLRMPCLDVFAFVDAGYVSLHEFALGRWAASTGFGIRIEVMRNMPLMFGLGWPIHPTERLNDGRKINNAQRFFFAIGGSF